MVRCQAPCIRHVNDDPSTWAELWRLQVQLGAIPYYMFVERDTGPKRYFELPLARVLEKLKAGKPVTIVTMGDSLTDYRHFANRQSPPWVNVLRDRLKGEYRSDVTIVNPAIGGTQLRQGAVLIPRWVDKTPEPDLVTICYGFNDWGAGMRGDEFYRSYLDVVDRFLGEQREHRFIEEERRGFFGRLFG